MTCQHVAVLVVLGEALVDLVISPDGRVEAALGGAPFNTARAAARLGAEVEFGGVLSTDRFGTMLAERLVDDGVGLSSAPRTELPTTLAAAELDEHGAATYRFYFDGTSAPALGEWPALPERTRAVFTGGLALVLEPMASTVLTALPTVAAEVLVAIDVNARPKIVADRGEYLSRLAPALARADVVKVSDDDLAYLAPEFTVESIFAGGAGAVVITAGSQPTIVRTAAGERRIDVPRPPSPIVDTIGAGDTFGGALLAELLRVGSGDLRSLDALADAVVVANRAAGIVVTRRGADPPTRSEL